MGEATQYLDLLRTAPTEAERRERFNQLYTLVYNDLRRVAHGLFTRERGGIVQPTEVVDDIWCELFGSQSVNSAANRNQFLKVAATAMRNYLIDQARKRNSEKRGGKTRDRAGRAGATMFRQDPLCLIARALAKRYQRLVHVVLEEGAIGLLRDELGRVKRDLDDDAPRLLSIERAVATLRPEDARFVELRFYNGYTVAQTAEILRLKGDTARKRWRRIKALLARQLEEWHHDES